MGRSARLGLFLFLTAATSCLIDGCSLIVDTSGLSGGPNDEGGGANGDGRADASTTGDGPSSADAPADGPKVCTATFCDDFDDGPLGAKWSRTILMNGGTLDLGTPAQSAPNALRARFNGKSAPTDRLALLEQDFGIGKKLHCDFSFMIQTVVDMDLNEVFRVHMGAAGISDYLMYFGLSSTGIILANDVAYTDGGCACPLVYRAKNVAIEGRWVQVAFDTDFTTASVSIDGTKIIEDNYGAFSPNQKISVALGGRAFSSITSDTLFDDFSCTLSP